MMRLAYNTALCVAGVPAALPLYVWARRRRPRFREALPQRLGRIQGLPPPPRDRPLWLHGVSLGEVRTLRPLVEAWLASNPHRPIVISASTETGLDAAHALYDACAQVTPFPLDLPSAVRAHLAYWRPALVALLETEIWPNFFWGCAEHHIPLCIISGRVSERTLAWGRVLAPLWRDVLACGTAYAMQTAADAERLLALGAPPDRVHVHGDLKWETAAGQAGEALNAWCRAWGVAQNDRVLLWGSTHDPEERLALETWQRLRARYPRLKLCVTPRHPERFDAVAQALAGPTHRLRRYSQGPSSDWDVLLVDTTGELATLYGLATVAVMGGTFAPVGGHNIVEALAAGAPLVLGPHTHHVRHLVQSAQAVGALIQTDEPGLFGALEGLFGRAEERDALAAKARALVAQHRGTARRLCDFLQGAWPVATP